MRYAILKKCSSVSRNPRRFSVLRTMTKIAALRVRCFLPKKLPAFVTKLLLDGHVLVRLLTCTHVYLFLCMEKK